jgi:Co/Zn/Cd efflux system component
VQKLPFYEGTLNCVTKAMGAEEKPTQVCAAAGANLAIAASKLIAAVATGSSAMLSEAIHSMADTGNQLLLYWASKEAGNFPINGTPSAMVTKHISGDSL